MSKTNCEIKTTKSGYKRTSASERNPPDKTNLNVKFMGSKPEQKKEERENNFRMKINIFDSEYSTADKPKEINGVNHTFYDFVFERWTNFLFNIWKSVQCFQFRIGKIGTEMNFGLK